MLTNCPLNRNNTRKEVEKTHQVGLQLLVLGSFRRDRNPHTTTKAGSQPNFY
jgi:hypothetical protein